jgi:OmpA-OmpF porin, OOP family
MNTQWLVGLFLLSQPVMAAGPDAEGCKDSPSINRISGCRIYECSFKDFDQADIRVGGDEWNPKKVSFEGQIDRIVFACPGSVGVLQVLKNYENAFSQKGFKTIFSGKKGDYEGDRVTTLQKGKNYVYVYAYPYPHPPEEGTYYEHIIATSKEMTQELKVDAKFLEEQLAKNNRVTVYGIEFDYNKSVIRAESESVLGEIVKVLQKNPDWKMRVEGHTDSTGSKTSNQKLSEERAASVVKWIGAKGVASGRLQSKGWGDSKPLVPNTTEENKAKNRRVELVKI